MTPRRAFWEALATACVPSFVIWVALLYFLRIHARPTVMTLLFQRRVIRRERNWVAKGFVPSSGAMEPSS
jgi:hypothetical protein